MGQSSPWGSAVPEPGVGGSGRAWSLGGSSRASALSLSEKPGPAAAPGNGWSCSWWAEPQGGKPALTGQMIFQLFPIDAGKSSLLCRGIHHGNGCLHPVIAFTLQPVQNCSLYILFPTNLLCPIFIDPNNQAFIFLYFSIQLC